MRLKLLGLALLALAVTPAPALGAPTWLEETAPFGDVPAQMQDADAAMAPDGTIVFARFAPGGALEVRERPSGGPVGGAVTIEPVTVNPQPFPDLQVLAAQDGTAAVLFDAGPVRYAALRTPGGRWGRPEPLMPSRAERGQVALAPDGVLWGVGETPGEPGALSLFRLPHQAPIPLPASARMQTDGPALTVPRAGVAHVVYVERFNDTAGPQCSTVSFLRAVDVTTAAAGPKRTLDAYVAEGEQGANGCTLRTGEVLFPAPRLSADAAGGENVLYSVLAVDGVRPTLLAEHRDGDGDWSQAPEEVAQDAELRDLAGPAAVLGGDGDEGVTIAVRGGDGRWRRTPLTGRTWISKLRAVHSGAGTTVFAWSEGVAGGAARARALGADGVLGAPVELDGGGTNVLGLGADAQGNAVALYSVQRPDLSFRLAARGFDAAGPRVTLSAPERGSVGTPLEFSADVRDVWSATRTAWDFGDGTGAEGLRATHSFGAAGAFTVRLQAVDAVGNATTAARGVTIDAVTTPPPPADTRAPVVSRVRVTPAHPHRGDPVTLTLATDEAGRAQVALAKLCRRCPHRTVARSLRAGTARIPLGRLSLGTWRLTLTVTDAAGNSSPAAVRTVRITRGPSTRAGR